MHSDPQLEQVNEVHTDRPPTGIRARMRRTPGGAYLLKALVFVVGLLFIALGVVLVALPGPLTIPPVLVGLYLWSTEFEWAGRLLARARESARKPWENARAKPVTSALVTLGGLVAVGVAIYMVGRFDVVARGKDLLGL